MTRALAMISGGLDSILAAKLIKDQGIEVIGICFKSYFFNEENAIKMTKQIGIRLEVVDFSEEQFEVVKNPKHGWGKNMNPCIDCHALMMKHSGRLLEEFNADFIITGEVLNQRPMSQNRQALNIVKKESGFSNKILRPLCALNLDPTEMELNGLVDREKLLKISGRSRKPQMELAEKWGIKEYPSPAGGCKLTEPNYSIRLRDALNRNEMIESAYGKEGSVPAKSILVPEADFYTEEGVEGYDQDTNKAKDLLDKSGVKIDKLKIGYNTGRFGHKNYALVAQQELKKIGIEAEIVPYESKAFFNILFSNSTECDMYVNGYAWGLEPNPYRGMFETGQYCNQTKYSNAEIDALWEKGFTELNKEKREEIYKQIQQDISKDAPIYTIDYEQNLMAAQKNLKGIKDAKPSPAILFEDWSKLYVE